MPFSVDLRRPALCLLFLLMLAAAMVCATAHAGQSLTPTDDAAQRLFAQRFRTLDGTPATLAQERGRPLLVNFWARWCQPCRAELPLLARLQREQQGLGLRVVGIALDRDAAAVARFVRDHRGDYRHWLAADDIGPLLEALGDRMRGLPLTLAIDRHGKIVALHLGAAGERDLLRLSSMAQGLPSGTRR